MAELYELRPAAGSHRRSKRKGRGPGSGKGKTAGRGENGQKSRSGGSIRPGFEGGQMPLQRRIPKRGFTPHKRHVFQIVNVGELARIEGKTVNAQSLKDAGLIRTTQGLIKLLAMGEVGQAYSVEAHKFSAGAAAKIEAAGGSVTTLGPTVAEAPAASSAPSASDTSSVTDESAVTDEPTATEEPTSTDESAGTDDSAEAQEAAATDEPTATDEPNVTDEPTVTDEPAAEEEAENDG